MGEPLCDICKEKPWGPDKAIYVATAYWEFLCGARLCEDCQAIIEATMDELAGRQVSQQMRTESWELRK